MVYARVIRMERDATFGAFDAPDAGQLCPKRTRSTTALQCLNLFNSPFVARRAEAFAKRLRKDAGDDRRAQVVRGFWLAFGRAPDPTELAAGIAIITTHSLDGFCRALLNANELLQLP